MKTSVGWVSLVAVLAFGCGPEPSASDAGLDASVAPCTCDDGLYCNGAELCAAQADGGTRCEPGTPPCSGGETCDEDADTCEGECDADGDGHDAVACGGDDCDDDDPNRYVGNLEVCDAEGHDEDCNPTTLGPDGDGDGHPSDECCNTDADGDLVCGGDCDDESAAINPGVPDGCGGGDQDCDGTIDEEPDSTFFRDQDDDNYGDDAETLTSCSLPSGYAARGGDCADDPFAEPDANEINPGASEICDSVDNDCDGAVDDGLTCDCDISTDTSRSCGVDPALDGIGICRLGTQMCQASGMWTVCAGATAPREETCNNLDDDCDGTPDDGVEVRCFVDADRDGYAAADGPPPIVTCTCTPGYTANDPATTGPDCNDGDDTIHPGAPEMCDRIDSNCSVGGAVDVAEDRDNDGYAPRNTTLCDGGFPRTDCHDTNASIRPGAAAQGVGYCQPGCLLCTNGLCQTPHPTFGCMPVFGGSCSTGTIAPSFDYDCSGSHERTPSSAGGGCSCPSGFACGGDGVTYGGSPACGSSVTHWSCGSGACGSSSCYYRTFSGPLPCR